MSDEPIPLSGALAPDRAQRKPRPETGAMATRSARLGRVGPLLAILNIGWALPSAASGTLLQALLARDYGTAGKVGALTAITTAGAVLAILGTVIGGALSDRTRSRFGRRNPWILGGAAASASGLTLTVCCRRCPCNCSAHRRHGRRRMARLAISCLRGRTDRCGGRTAVEILRAPSPTTR